ncbi:MAG TPA: pullulanase-type alpha-1,6-glucosidase [Tetrasphaera sp.]|uniref:pullulanase-type alpha-1,6-glucosidase n=1 Tax=Nostocoides sp. TaxID=1917966 RepID=UPI002CAEF872|nr:pullulanase-type alpha-1,6-glucosidase [Tetrasphaera sp.]HNQ07407.1 pullulanase-type alpha-1,6-glucosidase [Tetrasphaera sp.]
MQRRRSIAAVLGFALALFGLAGPHVTKATAADRTATLVGTLQDELGCGADWDPGCTTTDLTPIAGTTTYEKVFTVPAGSYLFKVAINHGWDESYGGPGGGNLPLVIQGPAQLRFSYDDTTHKVGLAPTDLPGAVTAADKAMAGNSLRNGLTKERFYFVMADRFANGSTANDRGGLSGDRLVTGFDPTDKGFYHGGDLKGIADKLDYIKGLGTTAIWLTPSFKNRPVQGSGTDASAGYHGYWITDFTQIDPHLGTNAEMKSLISKAHAKGMKVFFDIITNHTADVIDYAEHNYDYRSKDAYPYKDASGQTFDDKTYAGATTFPTLDPGTSFPYTPAFRTPADASVKVPAWLNDRTMYHNRGNSTFAGESSEYGDFVGLDDLFTERPEVVDGMTDIYSAWVDLGIDGFRIDTVKHVNMQFWQRFAPAVLEHATAIGNSDFFMFGEVYESAAKLMSQYTTTGRLPATLDFGFQANAVNFAGGKETTSLRDFFGADDWYTDTDSNVYETPTFLGNHDMGRVAMMLAGKGFSGADLLARVKLANSLMYLTRGQPVVYYGDEQGFIGSGGDKDARQDMFATKVAQYAGESNLTGASGSRNRYATTAPLYQQLTKLAALRAANPALADGAQVHRYASNSAGIYAFSRVDRASGIEYLVVANNATSAKSASFDTFTTGVRFAPLLGGTALTSGPGSRVSVTVPALTVRVYKAGAKVAARTSAPPVYLTSPAPGEVIKGRAQISAATTQNAFAQTTFAYRPVGTTTWQTIGTDDAAPYSVYQDVSGLTTGTLLEYRVVVKDSSGNYSASSSYATVDGVPAPGTKATKRATAAIAQPADSSIAARSAAAIPVAGSNRSDKPGKDAAVTAWSIGPVTQPDFVSVPGSFNSELGCTGTNAGDWQPDCAFDQLTLDVRDGIWKGTFDLPAGDYEYKAAINKSWTENYGAGGAPNGGNIALHHPGGQITFYYDPATHGVTSNIQGPIITAPGSMQSELGCTGGSSGGDWQPDCMNPWLQDLDGDGTYTWTSDQIPAGDYEFKIAHNLTWDENYGAGGAPGGANVPFSLPRDGVVVTISYVLATHEITVTTSASGAAPNLKAAKAFWVQPGLLAWPADAVPDGANPALLKWRLHWAPNAGMTIDAEDLPGSTSAGLAYDPAGLPSSVTASRPELKGYLALRLGSTTAAKAPTILRGQVAVALYSNAGGLLDATGVQTAYVLDALYAASAKTRTYGASFAGTSPTYRVWAPTAKTVTLLTWAATAPGDAPLSTAKRTAMTRATDGSWSVTTGVKNARYLYEIVVYVRSTGNIETVQVTDPYSVALTLNSTKSVAVNLKDIAFRPSVWARTPQPRIAQNVDSSIYELHVRDFSISDTSVPAELRGSYLAFNTNGKGMQHLKALAAAGLNTIHLLPTFDIASIQEDPAKQTTPACDLGNFPPDSEQQQACIDAIRANDAFNWGYDPFHWLAPEGSYASTAAAADGGTRVAEFRTMVGALHKANLRVVLDQVFNHTPTSGLAPTSVLDKVVPDYYQRLDARGNIYTSTCCQNIATEHQLAQQIMVDAVVMWARDYKIDGFRFDLMGHHSRANMLAIRAALNKLTTANSGVDGSKVYLYGEGWNFGEVANNALFTQATQGQLGGTHIGTFSDRLRDAVRGGGPFDDDPRKQGFGSGEFTDPNGAAINDGAPSSLQHDTDLVQLGLAGNLKDFSFRLNSSGQVVTGKQVDYNGSPAGYASNPDEVITYVDAHDNETLFDSLTFKLPVATSMSDRVRMNTLSLATTALAQTPSFWHAGADLLRSKSLDRNSYDSGDWFNRLDWTGNDNGFGHGLPLKGDNEAKWSYMRPLLGNAALKPSAQDVATATAQAQQMLELRYSTRLLRLGSTGAIKAKLTFPASGTADATPGVIVMRIDDTVGADLDPGLKGLVVVFNATPNAVTQVVPGMSGMTLALSPVQAGGSDPVVKTSAWNTDAGSATVPARTVAVFVQK